MITIQPLQAHQIPEAKAVIMSVARDIFGWESPFEEILEIADENHDLYDVDDAGNHYFGNGGIFLVALDDERVVGTGAVRRLDDDTCELKRMWLLEEYQGYGIGYRMMQELIGFARWAGYQRIQLDTHSTQERAIQFYLRVGFDFIEAYNNSGNDVFMEIEL